MQLHDRVVIKVVIVVVRDEHKIDVGQVCICQAERRLHNAPAPNSQL